MFSIFFGFLNFGTGISAGGAGLVSSFGLLGSFAGIPCGFGGCNGYPGCP
jgi:hypothetical protein